MASFNKFHVFSQDIGREVHHLHSDSLKVMLTNVAPSATDATISNITEITPGNGYSAGGMLCGSNSYIQTGGVAKLLTSDVTLTAAGPIGPFRYAVLYNSTAAGGPLIGYYDYGSSITLNVGETFTVDFDGTAGTLTLT